MHDCIINHISTAESDVNLLELRFIYQTQLPFVIAAECLL